MARRKRGKVRGVGTCTVNPADGHRLEDGEKQQAGSTAGEMVIDLEHIQTTLHRQGEGGGLHYSMTQKPPTNRINAHLAHPSTYRRDHDQSQQEADDADAEQQQFPAVASSDQVRVQVSNRRHQRLQTHKLDDRRGGYQFYMILHQCRQE